MPPYTPNATAMTAAARVLRTIQQILVAVLAVVPAFVVLMDAVNVNLNEVAIAAVVAAAIGLVTAVQNALEKAGFIPTLFANVGRDPDTDLDDAYLDRILEGEANADGMIRVDVARAVAMQAAQRAYEDIQANED